jgi:protein-S-isoprenylcysteine O-methyltransferase Ste14
VIFIPPPLYYAAGLAGGLAVDAAIPLAIGGRPGVPAAGAVLTAAGLALTGAAVTTVIRHRTTIVPHHPVTTLLTSGPYRLSRNPMYAGLAIAYAGLTLLTGTWWPAAFAPLVIYAVHRLAIRPEERYLTERFGRAYTDYRARVRRWL